MELPVMTVYQLIQSLHYGWIDELYSMNIPPGADTSGKQTIVLITSITEPLGGFRNDQFSNLQANIQIQIFWKKETQENIFNNEVALMNDLENQDWLVSSHEPNTVDPDTDQVTATFS
ncbi:MAG: DUF806 family protein, partial [Lactiplantibacillus plantarum]|nr:DUF806 family protein [Lactiplantibacillus plantarum]